MKTINMNVKISKYTSKVLGVIKEKYSLKDKGEALNKFTDLYGEEFVEKEIKENIPKDVINSCEYHIKKYGFRSRNTKDLKKRIEEK